MSIDQSKKEPLIGNTNLAEGGMPLKKGDKFFQLDQGRKTGAKTQGETVRWRGKTKTCFRQATTRGRFGQDEMEYKESKGVEN